MEQYFSGNDDNTTDYVLEGIMRSLINSTAVALENPQDYDCLLYTSCQGTEFNAYLNRNVK